MGRDIMILNMCGLNMGEIIFIIYIGCKVIDYFQNNRSG